METAQLWFSCLAAGLALTLAAPAHGQQLDLDVDDLVVEARIERVGDDGVGFGFGALWVPARWLVAGSILRIVSLMTSGTGIGLTIRHGGGSLWIAGLAVNRIAVPQ